MTQVTIPDTHFVGIQLDNVERDENQNPTGMPLGFLTPGGTNAAAKKRISTVRQWICEGEHIHDWIMPEDVEAYKKKFPDAEFVRTQQHRDASVFNRLREEGKDYSIIEEQENTPQEGFRITKSVARYGWNGGNKLVRIEDPRGFELEISVANLVKCMETTTFENGVCMDKCVWGRDGAANVLLPVSSQPYKDAFDTTTYRKAETIGLRDVNFGDVVTTKATSYLPEFTGEYIGAYYVYSLGEMECREDKKPDWMDNKRWAESNKMVNCIRRYVLRCEVDGKVQFNGFSKLNITEIVSTQIGTVDRPKKLDLSKFKDNALSGTSSTFAIISDKVDLVSIAESFTFVDAPDDIVETLLNPPEDTYVHNTKAWAVDPKDGAKMQRQLRWDYETPKEEENMFFVGWPIIFDPSNNLWYHADKPRGENSVYWRLGNAIPKVNINNNYRVDSVEWVTGKFVINGEDFDLPLWTYY